MKTNETLKRYVADRSHAGWRRTPDVWGHSAIALTSGMWRGLPWKHSIVVVNPEGQSANSSALLYVTGGDPNPLDIAEAQAIANRSGSSVALLFHIPNQPLFELWEDDLIAHTFTQFIETGNDEWPLLLPMTRAAVRAMDALEDELSFERFVVAGASKRGWTSWLAACAGDARVSGVAPMVFDNLKFQAQMQHQLASWGAYSEQISDYTIRDLPGQAQSERGGELVRLVDPYLALDDLSCPILVINGSNDAYWTADALSLYWNDLPDPKNVLVVPNTGHLLGDKRQMVETLSEFLRRRSMATQLPSVSVEGERDHFRASVDQPCSFYWWRAEAESRDLRNSIWHRISEEQAITSSSEAPVSALLLEARFQDRFSLSSPVIVRER